MRIIPTLLLSLVLFSSPAYAGYKKTFNPDTGVGDFVGVSASRDVAVVCDSGKVLKSQGSGAWECGDDAGASSGAPTDAKYITQTADGTLSAEQALSLLSSGIMRVATTTGVITSLTDSAGIAANISDESGTGVMAFTTSPVFTTPNIGSATGSVSGNAGTATALAANGANASAGNAILGVDASGAAEGAFDVIVPTEIDASSEIAAIVADETGTGLLVFGTAPTLLTADIKNGATSAGYLSIYEDSDDGSNYTRIQAQAQAGNVTYTLPAADGAANARLKTNGSGTLAWQAEVSTLSFVIDGGGSAITTGVKGDLEIPFACTINQATTLADQSGSIVVDIWKDSYANYPPTDADSITASAPPTISSATKAQDATLTGWTTAVAAGDTIRYNVDSATTVTRVVVSLKCTKT